MTTITKSDPALALAQRIYVFKRDDEPWTTAVDRYAREVLFRHPRTVHRWLAGESPIPDVVRYGLGLEAMPDEEREKCDRCHQPMLLDASGEMWMCICQPEITRAIMSRAL